MLEIALCESENGVLQKHISERQKISVKYLDSIISSLKTAGLITTIKGKKSGYRLTRPPALIRILDIYRAFEPDICIVDCLNSNYVCEMSGSCGVRDFWGGLNSEIASYFEAHTLEDIMKEQLKLTEVLTPGDRN